MTTFNTIPRPHLSLFRLIIRMQGAQQVAYSLGESIDDAFKRYVVHIHNRQETTDGLEFIEGDLANPYPSTRR